MLDFFNSLTPTQIAIVAGALLPFVQFGLDKIKPLTGTMNWLLAFLLPIIVTVGTALATSPEFNQLFPLYGSVFATAQMVYFTSVKWIKMYLEVKGQLEAAESF